MRIANVSPLFWEEAAMESEIAGRRIFEGSSLEGLEGMPAAQDMPEVVVSAANEHLLCS